MRRLLRSLLFPILIFVVAGLLTWNARRTQESHAQPADVVAFVRSAMTSGEYGATDPILVDRLKTMWPTGEVRVEIEVGDGGPAADGSATHRAAIATTEGVKLIVRCRYADSPAERRFVGYWVP